MLNPKLPKLIDIRKSGYFPKGSGINETLCLERRLWTVWTDYHWNRESPAKYLRFEIKEIDSKLSRYCCRVPGISRR